MIEAHFIELLRDDAQILEALAVLKVGRDLEQHESIEVFRRGIASFCKDAIDSLPPVLIWSTEHGQWWGVGECGYVNDRRDAGRYSVERAAHIVREANRYRKFREKPNESIVPLFEGESAANPCRHSWTWNEEEQPVKTMTCHVCKEVRPI